MPTGRLVPKTNCRSSLPLVGRHCSITSGTQPVPDAERRDDERPSEPITGLSKTAGPPCRSGPARRKVPANSTTTPKSSRSRGHCKAAERGTNIGADDDRLLGGRIAQFLAGRRNVGSKTIRPNVGSGKKASARRGVEVLGHDGARGVAVQRDHSVNLSSTNRAPSRRTISNGVRHFTATASHAFGILILLLPGELVSCGITSNLPASARATK